MSIRVTVAHSDGGWTVRSEALAQPGVFASGARAEAAAHDHARRLSASGCDVTVEIFARDARLAGATRYPGRLVA